MITEQDLSDEYILPCQAQIDNTIVLCGDPIAKGLIVFQDPDDETFFFIPQIEYQDDFQLVPLQEASILIPQRDYLINKLGEDIKGLWVAEEFFSWQTLQPELFPFYVQEHLSLHQLIMKLHKEIL